MDQQGIRVDGNVATLSGVHSGSTDPSLAGKPFWFRVVDFGEGANAQPDEMTLVVTFPGGSGPTCQDDYPFLDLIPIEGGNIQVHK